MSRKKHLWFYYLIATVYFVSMIIISVVGERVNKEQKMLERQEDLRKNFSRMSSTIEIQEAYDAIDKSYD